MATKEVKIPGPTKEYTPPLVEGDDDWDEGFDSTVQAQTEIFQNSIRARVYMKGRELESDWTTVEGWSEWSTLYQAPAGWKINSALPLGTISRSHQFGENEKLKTFEETGDGAVVQKLEVYGFEGSNPHTAGTYTRVIAHFNPIVVEIEEEQPADPAEPDEPVEPVTPAEPEG